MAKNGRIKLISLIAMFAILFAGIVTTWAVYGSDIEVNSSENAELKEEGCLPARKNTTDIAVITGQLETIQTEQRSIKADTKEILKRLPE